MKLFFVPNTPEGLNELYVSFTGGVLALSLLLLRERDNSYKKGWSALVPVTVWNAER